MKYTSVATFTLLTVLLVVSAFRTLDKAMEVDDLRSHIRLQNDAIEFLESVNNAALSSCSIKVEGLRALTNSSKYQYTGLQWNEGRAQVGPFEVRRDGECVTEIKLVGLP